MAEISPLDIHVVYVKKFLCIVKAFYRCEVHRTANCIEGIVSLN